MPHEPRIAPTFERPRASGCAHTDRCACRRPQLGVAAVLGVGLQLVMGLVTVATGATTVGLLVCSAMAVTVWLLVVVEVATFYRVGVPEPQTVNLSRTVVHHNQASRTAVR